jgi:hypothetical protein
VERAARAALADIDTDHAAADLLFAVAQRLAQDVDESTEVRDRVAAVKELRAVLADLDTAVMPPARPTSVSGAAPAEDGDRDVFNIGDSPPGLPPVVGDAEAG